MQIGRTSCIKYGTKLSLSSPSAQSGFALKSRGQAALWQRLHQIAKSLSRLCSCTSGTEGRTAPRSLSQHIHTVFRRALYGAARSHVSPRAAGFRGIESADGGVVQSPSMMYSCSAVCLPDNLRSQYPEANLKPLSLSPRVEM